MNEKSQIIINILFKNKFNSQSTPCQHPVVMLAGIGAEDLEILLEFVYRGEVSVESSQLPSLLQAAHSLSIHGLTPPTILPNVSLNFKIEN